MKDTDRLANLAKARATTRFNAISPEKVRAREALTVRDKYLEETVHAELATRFKVRLPNYGQVLTTGKMEAWLRKVKVPIGDWKEHVAVKTLKEEITLLDGQWPLRAWAGLVLEYKEQQDEINHRGTSSTPGL